MANICSNTITITGNKARLIEFDKQFKQNHLVIVGGTTQDLQPKDYYKYYRISEARNELIYIKDEYQVEGYSYNNFKQLDRETFLNGWAEWSRSNWGIITDCQDMQVSGIIDNEENSTIYYSFVTNWDEPYAIVEEMARQYPDLTFRHEFVEESMDYAGYTYYENGICKETLYNEDTGEDYRKFMRKHFS